MKTIFMTMLLAAGLWGGRAPAPSMQSGGDPLAAYLAPETPDSLKLIARGSTLFNQTLPCGRCHGYHLRGATDSTVPELKDFSRRYGENATTTFRKILDEGRPDKGMPGWKYLTETQKTSIEAYVFSLQQ